MKISNEQFVEAFKTFCKVNADDEYSFTWDLDDINHTICMWMSKSALIDTVPFAIMYPSPGLPL